MSTLQVNIGEAMVSAVVKATVHNTPTPNTRTFHLQPFLCESLHSG